MLNSKKIFINLLDRFQKNIEKQIKSYNIYTKLKGEK